MASMASMAALGSYYPAKVYYAHISISERTDRGHGMLS